MIKPNVVALIANAQHAEDLFQGFETLENTALLTQPNIDALIEDAQSYQRLTVNQTTLRALPGGTFAFHTCFNTVNESTLVDLR